MFQLTNYSVRRRYLAEKSKAEMTNKEPFTYADMAAMFEVDERTIYTWITKVEKLQHLPTNEVKRNKLIDWINDGNIIIKEKKK